MTKRKTVLAMTMLAVLLASGSVWAEKPRVETGKSPEVVAPGEVFEDMKATEALRMKRREIMLQAHEANKAISEQASLKRKELEALAKADKFDKAAYVKKHGEIQELKRKMEDEQAAVMAEALSKMSKEDRQAMGSGFGRHRRMMMHKPGLGVPAGAGETPKTEKK